MQPLQTLLCLFANAPRNKIPSIKIYSKKTFQKTYKFSGFVLSKPSYNPLINDMKSCRFSLTSASGRVQALGRVLVTK